MIDRNIDYNILIEAEAVAAAYARRKPDNINISDVEWLAAGDETKLLLIHTQKLAMYLGEAYIEAEKQGNQEQASLLYQILKGRPCLSSIDPSINNLHECIDREIEYTVDTRLWIKETKEIVFQNFPEN